MKNKEVGLRTLPRKNGCKSLLLFKVVFCFALFLGIHLSGLSQLQEEQQSLYVRGKSEEQEPHYLS